MPVNVSLPGDPKYAGLWPAIWTMGQRSDSLDESM